MNIMSPDNDIRTANEKAAGTILKALQGKHVYLGTVTEKTKATRRKKNKLARAARRAQRG